MKIVKRDGTLTAFDITKILAAIGGAFTVVRGCAMPEDVERRILTTFDWMSLSDEQATVEQVQDRIESLLIESGCHDVAKAYILHCAEHAENRFFRDRAQFVDSYSDPSRNSADIILYLPLISSVKVKSSDGTSTVVGATAAVATTSAFHANVPVFEQLYGKIFNSTLGCQVAFRIGSIDVGSVYPNTGYFLDAETADRTISSAVNTSTYTLQWLAGYANIHLAGFKKSDKIYSSIDLYPSADPTIKQKLEELSDPFYAKLVIFNDVNTTMTPVYNYYSEGSHLYDLLWGEKWQ